MSWVCGSVHCQPRATGAEATTASASRSVRGTAAVRGARIHCMQRGDSGAGRSIVGGHAQFCREDVVLIDGRELPRGLGRGNGCAEDKKPDGTS